MPFFHYIAVLYVARFCAWTGGVVYTCFGFRFCYDVVALNLDAGCNYYIFLVNDSNWEVIVVNSCLPSSTGGSVLYLRSLEYVCVDRWR